jgi:hypothetical protein
MTDAACAAPARNINLQRVLHLSAATAVNPARMPRATQPPVVVTNKLG